MSTFYLFGCMWRKLSRKRRSILLVFFGMLIAALGVVLVASISRNRELQAPWHAQRSTKITFDSPVSPAEAYRALHAEYVAGTVNGYALIADTNTSGGISLGGQEGSLWYPVSADDACYSTAESLFWIHHQAVPERYFHALEDLTAEINGLELTCAGLTYYGLNWDWPDESSAHSVSLLLDGKPARIGSPTRELVYIGNDWLYIAPVLVSANWLADNHLPIVGICVTLTVPNDQATLDRVASQLSTPFAVTTEWKSGRLGPLTANEWLYLGVLLLAMLNIASLYDGLLDSYGTELFLFRKLGIARGAIYRAVLLLIAAFSVCAFSGAWLLYAWLLRIQGSAQWLSPLPVRYISVLFLAYVGISILLALRHTRQILRAFRKKDANL